MKRRSFPVFLSIPPDSAAVWKKKIPPARFSPGQVLFYRGHFPYGILIIHSGLAELRLRATDQKGQHRVGPNSVLGLSHLLEDEAYSLTAVVVEEVEASFVERTLVHDLSKETNAETLLKTML